MASEPMTDERLYEIEAICIMPGDVDDEAWEALRDSLLEIKHLRAALERLRAENAVMRPMVEALAEAGVGDEYGGGTWLMFAGYGADTVRTNARAFLASAGQAAASEGE